MNQLIDLILHIIGFASIYALVVLGVFLTSQIIRFDDLTVEGSFAAGGAFFIVFTRCFSSILLATLSASLVGAIAGCMTGFLHTRLKLNPLISGIVVTTMLFSINLKMAGANAMIDGTNTFFNAIGLLLGESIGQALALLGVAIGIVLFIHWFLKTEVGLLFKALGNNPQILTCLGKNPDFYKIGCIGLANGIIALAGALFVQASGFFSITGSIGTLSIALAGIIIGNVLARHMVLKIFWGALVYQVLIALTIELQIDPVWNRLTTAVLIVVLIAMTKNNSFRMNHD